MDTWLQFLTSHGARISDTANPEVLDFNSAANDAAPSSGFVAPLTDLGLIAFSGDDAAHFLHNQLTNDVEHLDAAHARLAGYCSPKGRLLATLLFWKSADGIMVQLPRAIQPAIQKRLQMFVLRAKVKVADAGDKVALGLSGSTAAGVLAKWFPAMPAEPYAKADADAGTLIRMADVNGTPRYQWITSAEQAQSAWPDLTAALKPAGAHAWRLSEILAGLPQITQATQEQFVPQMVNFELIGGVNFKKGCYPGQEIVARSQYLGKLKRRMMLATVAAADVAPGTEIFSISDREQPCGMVVNAEPVSPLASACLVEVKLAALDAGSVYLGTADGAPLEFMPLPYPLVDPS
jgi:tRNA-modifying protein YgfZ